MRFHDRRARKPSFSACLGALLAAASIALSAYAAHGIADRVAQGRLQTAAYYAFGHGAVLAALGASLAERWLGKAGIALLLLGTLLFSGSLAGSVLAGWSTALAPLGGSMLMLGWVVLAVQALRR
ncbi:MAG TPA: DUF423 domain-containing protein [Stenotrophomonas sp.]|nr:DUF423 domain-containing protein [Stenotrophomonas sp.]